MAQSDKIIHQPLHPSIRSTLDPQYVEFHDAFLQYVEPSESKSWDPASRSEPSPLGKGAQTLVGVGRVFDKELENIQIRVFYPEGDAPSGGWPCLVWLHGGGWVNGGLASENGFLRHVCKYVRCVVITINYRHAPEHVYPTAINDAFDGLKWIMNEENAKQLSINTACYSLGGLSAGGCLTASLSMMAALDTKLLAKPRFQVLICPVIDSTATVASGWKTSQYSPWLTPSRMAWYQGLYFPQALDKKNWDASPCFAPTEILATSPKTFVAISECDLLAPEGTAYSESLRAAGVDVAVKVYKGATHSILILAGIHKIGQDLVHDVCSALAAEFGTVYDSSSAPILPQEA